MSQRPQGFKRLAKSEAWQEDAWKFYDEVGELRFGTSWLSNGMSRVNLVAAKQPRHLGDKPVVIFEPDDENPDDEPLSPSDQSAHDLVKAIAGGPNGQGQLMGDMAIQLTVPGIGWVLMEAEHSDDEDPLASYATPGGAPQPDETWCWYTLSNEEVRQSDATNAAGERFYEMRVDEDTWRPLVEVAIHLATS